MYFLFDQGREQSVQITKLGKTGANIRGPQTIVEAVSEIIKWFKEPVFLLVFEADEETNLEKALSALPNNTIYVNGKPVTYDGRSRTSLIKFLNAFFYNHTAELVPKNDPFYILAIRLVKDSRDYGLVVSRSKRVEKGELAIEVVRGKRVKMPFFSPFLDQTLVKERLQLAKV